MIPIRVLEIVSFTIPTESFADTFGLSLYVRHLCACMLRMQCFPEAQLESRLACGSHKVLVEALAKSIETKVLPSHYHHRRR